MFGWNTTRQRLLYLFCIKREVIKHCTEIHHVLKDCSYHRNLRQNDCVTFMSVNLENVCLFRNISHGHSSSILEKHEKLIQIHDLHQWVLVSTPHITLSKASAIPVDGKTMEILIEPSSPNYMFKTIWRPLLEHKISQIPNYYNHSFQELRLLTLIVRQGTSLHAPARPPPDLPQSPAPSPAPSVPQRTWQPLPKPRRTLDCWTGRFTYRRGRIPNSMFHLDQRFGGKLTILLW